MGYLLSTLVAYAFAGADVVAQLLTVPSVIGELWIMGFLLLVGLRPGTPGARKTLS